MCDKPIAEGCELRWHPTVEGHVGEDARAVEETCLRGDEQEQRLGDQSNQHKPARATAPVGSQVLKQHRVERLAFLIIDVQEEVGKHQSCGGERQRDGHVVHRPLASLHFRLAQNGQAVTDRFDSGVGASAHTVRA